MISLFMVATAALLTLGVVSFSANNQLQTPDTMTAAPHQVISMTAQAFFDAGIPIIIQTHADQVRHVPYSDGPIFDKGRLEALLKTFSVDQNHEQLVQALQSELTQQKFTVILHNDLIIMKPLLAGNLLLDLVVEVDNAGTLDLETLLKEAGENAELHSLFASNANWQNFPTKLQLSSGKYSIADLLSLAVQEINKNTSSPVTGWHVRTANEQYGRYMRNYADIFPLYEIL